MSRSKTALVSGSWRSRRRWTAEDAREALEAQAQSGLSPARFAAQEGIEAQRLYWWSRRLGAVKHRAEFVELVPARVGSERRRFEVVLRSGVVVRVGEDFDPAALVRLITTLESVAC